MDALTPRAIFVLALLEALGRLGVLYGVTYWKSDGSIRRMTARGGVRRGVTGTGMAYDARARGLVPVWDVRAVPVACRDCGGTRTIGGERYCERCGAPIRRGAWRMVNASTVCEIRVGGLRIDSLGDTPIARGTGRRVSRRVVRAIVGYDAPNGHSLFRESPHARTAIHHG